MDVAQALAGAKRARKAPLGEKTIMENDATEHGSENARGSAGTSRAVPPTARDRCAPGAAVRSADAPEGRSTYRIAREEVVLDAMGAFDSLGRHLLMAERAGLTKTQVDILVNLALNGQLSMSHLASSLAVSKEHITRAVGSLASRGLVEKVRGTDNFRKVRARLTADGEKLADSLRHAGVEKLNRQLETLSPEDRETLLQASEQAVSIVRKIARNQRAAEAAALAAKRAKAEERAR